MPVNPKDQVFADRVAKVERMFKALENPPEGFVRQCLEYAVWPAMNRFSRFDTKRKQDNYHEFMKLCKAVGDLGAQTVPAEPTMKRIGARTD